MVCGCRLSVYILESKSMGRYSVARASVPGLAPRLRRRCGCGRQRDPAPSAGGLLDVTPRRASIPLVGALALALALELVTSRIGLRLGADLMLPRQVQEVIAFAGTFSYHLVSLLS